MVKIGDMTRTNESSTLPAVGRVALSSRDMTLAAGTSAITGVGFRPSFVLALSAEAVNGDTFSVGMCDKVQLLNRCITQQENDNTLGENHLIVAIQSTPVGDYFGNVQSFDSDGITIVWTKSGAPIGTFSLRFAFWK